MKILVTGAKGMLAQEIAKVFSDEELLLLSREELDVTDEGAVTKTIKKESPDVIINCAAYTNVEKAEEERIKTMKLNGEAVGNLARAASQADAIFVHFSTDYVFDGRKKEGYKEDDAPENPVNFYGISKLEGERLILNVAQYKAREKSLKYYLIRTSWVFGAGGKNFVKTITSLSRRLPELRVVDDQIGKPTYAPDLAEAVKALIKKKYPFGIYHLINEGAVTRYDYARKIAELFGLRAAVKPQSTKDSGIKVRRPQYSILLNTKFPFLRPWQEALQEYLETDKSPAS